MTKLRALAIALVLPASLGSQANFVPSRVHHVTLGQILAYGQSIDLRTVADSGVVGLRGRLYWTEQPAGCPDIQNCRVGLFLVTFDERGWEPPVVWALGSASLPQQVQWLRPEPANPQELARLRLRFPAGSSGDVVEQADISVRPDTLVVSVQLVRPGTAGSQ